MPNGADNFTHRPFVPCHHHTPHRKLAPHSNPTTPTHPNIMTELLDQLKSKVGLDGEQAKGAVQTVLGTSKLLDTGMDPVRLREMVTSPGGTTAAGLAVFDEKKFKDTVKAAIIAARNRSEELGRS